MTTQWHGGKGSRMRVPSVSDEVLADNWDRIFNKKGFDKQTIDMHEWFFTVLQLNSRG